MLGKQHMPLICLLMLGLISTTRGRTIDKIISDALSDSDSLGDANDGNNDFVRLELDMILSRDQYDALYGKSRNGRHKRKAIRSEWYRWPENEVPYEIPLEVFDDGYLDLIEDAMKEWERLTCLTFREKQSWDSDYVYFHTIDGCSSRVGKVGGPQLLSLASKCRHHGVIVHEIGHAIGFFHEHMRPDRDDYVRVNWENIKKKWKGNFNKSLSRAVNYYDVPYDYKSVMHYGKKYASVNGNLTIETINPLYQDVIGNRRGLSFHDVQLANRMYKCDASCPPTNPCPSDAYRGKDCKCYCNSTSDDNPVKECEDTVVTPQKPGCFDKDPDCEFLSFGDPYFCRSSKSFREACKKFCNLCEDKVVTPPKAECVNISQSCEKILILFKNACKKSHFKKICKKSCKLC